MENSARNTGIVRDALGRIRGGVPGNKGGGRKPDAFIAKCRALTDGVVLKKVAAKLRDATPDDPAWRWAAEYVSKYVKSEAPKHVELEHTGRIVIREKREPRVLIADN